MPALGSVARHELAGLALLAVAEGNSDVFEADLVRVFGPSEPTRREPVSFDGDILGVDGVLVASQREERQNGDLNICKPLNRVVAHIEYTLTTRTAACQELQKNEVVALCPAAGVEATGVAVGAVCFPGRKGYRDGDEGG